MLAETMRDTSEVVPPSADFVLEAIRESHRHQCAYDPEANPSVELSPDSTVADWRNACDLVATDDLGAALNALWEINVSRDDWRAVLEPPKQRRLREVCRLIASNAQRSIIRPAGALGAACAAAGAYWAIRGMLLRAGADPAALRPSEPIPEVARRFPEVFLGPIARLAPGRLPTVSIRTPWYDASLAVLGIGVAAMLAAQTLDWFGWIGAGLMAAMIWTGIALLLTGFLCTWLTARLRPREVRFGDIRTFRDLAEVIGGTPPR
jgi:hypothetical protein